MADLEYLSRREALRAGALLGRAALFSYLMPYSASAQSQQNPRDAFSRGVPYNIKSRTPIELDEFKSPYILTTQEQERFQEKLKHEFGNTLLEQKIKLDLSNISIKLLESYSGVYVKIEPDITYAQNLVNEARISIEHLFNFLNVPYLQQTAIDITIPREKKDFRFKFNKNKPFYLVADLGSIIVASYEVNIGGIKSKAEVKQSSPKGGETERQITFNSTNNGFEIMQSNDFPIFYNTSGDLVHLVEVPAIEALHESVKNYTFHNLVNGFKKKRIKSPEESKQEIRDLSDEYLSQEEKFVHALSILWLERYNQDRKLGLRKDELDKRFADYEKDPRFKGTNALARYIPQIGIPTAINLYVENPDELFKSLK